MDFMKDLKNGVLLDNPVFMQTIGLCPTLATTTSLSNAIGMGVAATVILIASNIVISALRKFIPDKVRRRPVAPGVHPVAGGVARPVPAADRCKLHHPGARGSLRFQEQGASVRA